MKVLVIGGTGNISTALTRLLALRGDSVTLYHRKATSPADGIVHVAGDRTDHARFEADMASLGTFDAVVDMVAYHPDDARSVVRALRGRTGHYVFCSTVDVFAKSPRSYPVDESGERATDPAFTYAHHKLECEQILEQARESESFPLSILRPAATYNDEWSPVTLLGPGPALMRRMREGRSVIVLGDGRSVWVSSHRDDVAPAFAAALGNPVAIGRDYNIPGDEWMSWQTYFEIVAEALGAPPPRFVPIPAQTLARAVPDDASWCAWNFQFNNIFTNDAAKRDLGYRYTVRWAEGVRRMVAHKDSLGLVEKAEPFALYDRIVDAWRDAEEAFVLGASKWRA